MDKSSALSFSYAKAAGLLSKAFIKDRSQALFQAESLADLWTLLFKEPAPLVPETLLARDLEEKAFSIFFDQYLFFINQYDKAPLLLTDKIKRFEIENLKEIIGALRAGEKELPHLLDLKDFSKIDTKAWPDLAKMTANTQYSWIKEVPSVEEQQQLDFKLDLELLRENWKAIQACRGEDREGHEKLFLDEYVIKNLFYVTEGPDKKDPLAAPAIKVLNYDVNKYEDWEKWEYAKYLNPYEPGQVWCVNPVWIERRYLAHQAKLAQQVFHQYVMEDAALAAWFKIKNYELTCIRTAVERLRLNIGSGEAMEAVGVNG